MTPSPVRPDVPDSKVRPPASAADLVRRPRLTALLDEATGSAAVTLLCAPAGTGKTLLLADWARTGAGATAWVSLATTDDRAGGLWTVVAEAVARCVPVLADDLRAAVRADRTGPDGLLAVLDDLPGELRLVLDDIQELTEPEVLDGLRTVIRYRPPHLRLVLAGRAAPALALPRLRLQDGVVDVHADQLRFTPEEAESLVAACGVVMSAGEIRRVHEVTGGWAAGLRLTALAAGRGTERSIAAYLEEEVLGSLSADDRAFLRDTSVCDAVAPSLAAALTGRDDAGAVLERLERETSLVAACPRRGHGYVEAETLLRSSLYGELRRRDPARRAELHGRAAGWCAAHERPAEAIRHARASGDATLLAALTRASAVPLVLSGDHGPLRRACAALGPVVVARDPVLRLVAPATDAVAGPAVALHGMPSPETAGLRALGAVVELATAVDDAADHARDEAAATLAEAADATARLLAPSERARGVRALEAASGRARDLGLDHLAVLCSAVLAATGADDADAARMTSHGAEVIAISDRRGWAPSGWSAAAHAALAYGSLLGARPGDARRHATEALAGTAGDPVRDLLLTAVRAAADADTGAPVDGLARMQRARTGAGDLALTAAHAARVAMLEHEVAVVRGRPAHAGAVRGWLAARVGRTGESMVMSVREALAADPRSPVGRSLRPVLDGTEPTLLPDVGIEALLLGAGDAVRTGDPAGARRLLIEALDRAAPLGLLRPFTHASWAVRELMAHQVGTFGAADGFARRGLSAGIQGRPVARSKLSVRESAILRLLPSLATTSEIAEDLQVSTNTVKTQVGAIYTKLGVNDRRAAVVAAYDAGLLVDDDDAAARSAAGGPDVIRWG
jgi:LuxR family maltose regulon positive regulatory protein